MMITPGNIESQGNHAAVTGRGIPSSQQPLNTRCEQHVNMNVMMNGKHRVCAHEHAVKCRHGMSHHPKPTWVLPACFQVNQVKKPFSSKFFAYVSVAFNSSLKTAISILTAILYVSWETHRKQGLPQSWLKQPSTEYVILRSVDDIEFHMFSLTQKYVQSYADYTSVEIHGFPVWKMRNIFMPKDPGKQPWIRITPAPSWIHIIP